LTRARNIIVGSETQHFEGFSSVTGVQRVVREAHLALTEVLTPQGVRVSPLHTRDRERRREFRASPYFSVDPVLDQSPLAPEDVDAFLFLDLHTHADFARVHREKRRRARPVISIVYDILPITHPEWCSDDPERVFRMYLQQLLTLSDHIVVTSEHVRNDLLNLGWRIPGEIHVIGLGSAFRPRAPESAADDRMSLLYVSTVAPRKGHELLLAAYDVLRAQAYDVDLSIVGGEGWRSADIASAIREHPDFDGRVRWYTNAVDHTVASLARASSIGVFPSSDEGFGLFVEEGLTYGLKMVVSDIPVFRERPQRNVTFASLDAQCLAEAIAAAHSATWLPPGRVRTMQDFGNDLAALVLSVVSADG
jgi:glycosyltransferase involved in cell wall biosynthesis